MFKLVSLLSLIFVLAACQSSQKSADRDPAQSKKGNGEVGSVSMSGTDYMNCESLDKKNHYRISVMEEGKELVLNLSKDANEIDSRYMSKTTWQQLTNQEIPFDITFSAYAISIKRFYRPTSSYLAGEVRSHGPTQKITCEEPRRTSQYSSPPRSPAQSSQGNGEVGSVDKKIRIGGACELEISKAAKKMMSKKESKGYTIIGYEVEPDVLSDYGSYSIFVKIDSGIAVKGSSGLFHMGCYDRYQFKLKGELDSKYPDSIQNCMVTNIQDTTNKATCDLM